MPDENQAAQVDPLDAFVQGDDQTQTKVTTETTTTESATVETELTETEKPVEDGFQKRINKVTADKYKETRRADDLQKQLDKLNANKPADSLTKPDLESFDYDNEAFNKAELLYQIQEGVKSELSVASERTATLKSQDDARVLADSFNERVTALDKKDFNEVADSIPELPAGVASALMQSENGAELIYHLGKHLDTADALAKMSPEMAMMELGRLSSNLSTKPEIKTSAAPDPIEPVKAGSSLNSEVGDEMSMDEWMAKYG